jgi:SAM-dependent methyltransferase
MICAMAPEGRPGVSCATDASTRGTQAMQHAKTEVRDFWDRAACGEALYLSAPTAEGYARQSAERYRLEPFIESFAEFARWRDRDVLEIGVGLGADHERFARAGARLSGVDLTPRAINHAARRLALLGLASRLSVGDAEALGFDDESFDLVYSWGVIHHSPDTARAAREILRVLRPGGEFRVMIYHKYSLVGLMLWARYALLCGRPTRPLDEIYAAHLESPGTKAYTRTEARALFVGAEALRVGAVLTHGDLLEGAAGQRHRGPLLSLARRLWPRRLLRAVAPNAGLFMLISGRKPDANYPAPPAASCSGSA